MPITARLSHTLHRTLGDDAATDLVDWMSNVDAQRAELRELNELNLARIDSRFQQVDSRLQQVDSRLQQVDSRLQQIDSRFQQVDSRFQQVDSRINETRHELRAEIAELRQEVRVGFAELGARTDSKIDRRFVDLIKWSFVFWCGTAAAALFLRR